MAKNGRNDEREKKRFAGTKVANKIGNKGEG